VFVVMSVAWALAFSPRFDGGLGGAGEKPDGGLSRGGSRRPGAERTGLDVLAGFGLAVGVHRRNRCILLFGLSTVSSFSVGVSGPGHWGMGGGTRKGSEKNSAASGRGRDESPGRRRMERNLGGEDHSGGNGFSACAARGLVLITVAV